MPQCIACDKTFPNPRKHEICQSCLCKKTKSWTHNRYDDQWRKNNSASKMAEKNPHWKGTAVCLRGLHLWVRSRLAKPTICPKCKKRPTLDLCNKGIYDRALDNWEWLCRKCHMESDGRMTSLRNKR